jgi:hypothetical protein
MAAGAEQGVTMTQNLHGNWVQAIPLPLYGLRKQCVCKRRFWTTEGYRGHYALCHVLILPSGRKGKRT